MRYIVLGASGQLGTDICRVLTERNISYVPGFHNDMDITDWNSVEGFLYDSVDKDDMVINCIAYNDVLAAEKDPQEALEVNAIGVYNLASHLVGKKALLVHFSTDYVFSDTTQKAVHNNWDNKPHPLTNYGKSKWIGEQMLQTVLPDNHIIIRTSGLFGDTPSKIKGNFLFNMWKKYQAGEDIHVYNNLIFKPTYAAQLADCTIDLIDKKMAGNSIMSTLHIANKGYCSWYQLALEFFFHMGVADAKLHSKEYSHYDISEVKRPLSSVLDTHSFDILNTPHRMTDWQVAVKTYANNLKATL